MDANTNTNQNGAATTPDMKLDVTVRPVTPQNNLMAFASVKINDCFVVDGLKVMNGKNGLFVNMPSTQNNKGEYRDVCKPITKEFREQLNSAVLTGYEKAIESMQAKLEAAVEVKKPSVLGQVNENKEKIQGQTAIKSLKKDAAEH